MFYKMHGHLNVLSDHLISDGLRDQIAFPRSVPFFAYLAQMAITDEPSLLQYYLDLELSSLLLGTQIDSNWQRRIDTTTYTSYDFIQEIQKIYSEKQLDSLKINVLSEELMQANSPFHN